MDRLHPQNDRRHLTWIGQSFLQSWPILLFLNLFQQYLLSTTPISGMAQLPLFQRASPTFCQVFLPRPNCVHQSLQRHALDHLMTAALTGVAVECRDDSAVLPSMPILFSSRGNWAPIGQKTWERRPLGRNSHFHPFRTMAQPRLS